jgi:hypothetical protein
MEIVMVSDSTTTFQALGCLLVDGDPLIGLCVGAMVLTASQSSERHARRTDR